MIGYDDACLANYIVFNDRGQTGPLDMSVCLSWIVDTGIKPLSVSSTDDESLEQCQYSDGVH